MTRIITSVLGLPKPELSVSSSVILPTTKVHLSCIVPQDPVPQCFFSVGTYTTSTSSCQLTLTGEQMKVWGHVNPPSVLPVKCFYTVNRSGFKHPSHPSSPVSVLVLGEWRSITTVNSLNIHSVWHFWVHSCLLSADRSFAETHGNRAPWPKKHAVPHCLWNTQAVLECHRMPALYWTWGELLLFY